MPKSITSCCLPRAFANDWTTTTRAFAICLCYCICWPPTPLRGIEGGKWGTLYSRETGGIYLYISLVTQSCPTLSNPWNEACQAFLSITSSQSILKLISIESVMPSNHLILVVPFYSCLQSFPASGSFPISLFFTSGGNKYWRFSFSISPSNEYSELISFRIDWCDLLVVQGTLKGLLQHSSEASIPECSACFMVQLSYPYMTSGKTIALTIWNFVGKVMSLFLIHCLGLS